MSRWLNRTLFGAPLWYALASADRHFAQLMRQLKVPRDKWPSFQARPTIGGSCIELEGETGKTCVVITIPDIEGSTGIDYASRIVHEAMHLWRIVRTIIGEDEPSAEFEAYSMENLTRELFTEYARQKTLQ